MNIKHTKYKMFVAENMLLKYINCISIVEFRMHYVVNY